MHTNAPAFLAFAVLGGLALFIYGMNTMTSGLREAAGSMLRTLLARSTHNRWAGLALGTLLGTLAQSSASTVTLVGFIDAGLLTLGESVAPMLGANLGTTLSMQLISFRLADYRWFAIAIGFLLSLLGPNPRAKAAGRALLGFGLIFLGLHTMSEAVHPHRAFFAGLLRGLHSRPASALILGTLACAAVTAIIQSSGAMVGMAFAFLASGVFTGVEQTLPILLGARIGTCATALLGSLGTQIQARRFAIGHLLFNVVTSAGAIAVAPWLLRLGEATSGDPIRQTANLFTIVALLGTAAFLPWTALYAQGMARLVPARHPPPEPSFLDRRKLRIPEQALQAALLELQRALRLGLQSLRLHLDVLLTNRRSAIRRIRLNEQAINEIKRTMMDYLNAMTRRYLSRRQALLAQDIDRCMADIERIGDHVEALCDLTLRRRRTPGARFDRETLDDLVALHEDAAKVLHEVAASLAPDVPDVQATAQAVLRERDAYMARTLQAQDRMVEKVSGHETPPIVGIFFRAYTSALDRTVKHAKAIALVEQRPTFRIKRAKLDRPAREPARVEEPQPIDPHDYLQRLHAEYYR